MEESKELQGFYKIFRAVIYVSILMEFFAYALVDGYPNLYPDLTWLPILSYTASKRVMHQLIEMSQIDKICWGCDTWTVEESYGSLLAFRFSLCSVLREKIEDGYLSVNNAKDIIDKILFDNAGKIYV